MDINELRQKRAEKIAQARSILDKAEKENRSLTDEEERRYDGLISEVNDLKSRIERGERQAALDAEVRTAQHDPIRPNPEDSHEDPEQRGRAQVTRDPADYPFRSFGEQLVAVARVARNAQDVDPRLLRLQKEAQEEMRATGMSEAVPSDGGFAVQKDFVTEIMQKTHQTGILSGLAQPFEVGPNSNGIKMNAVDESSRANGSRWGGIQGYWVNEAQAPTKSKPKLRRMNVDLEKMAALVYATEELLMDATALQSIIMTGVPQEFAFMLDDAMVNGDGSGKPLGILNSAALVSVPKESGQAAATLLYENIVKMWARGWARSRRNARWYINQDIEPQLYTMSLAVGTGGGPVFVPPGGASSSPFGTLLGRPIEPIEHAATLGTIGDIILADFSQYALVRKNGVQSATSIHVKFEEGETAFRFILRVNGQPMWDKALTPYKGSNTLSPFVALATRS